jgi:hypothetical protein
MPCRDDDEYQSTRPQLIAMPPGYGLDEEFKETDPDTGKTVKKPLLSCFSPSLAEYCKSASTDRQVQPPAFWHHPCLLLRPLGITSTLTHMSALGTTMNCLPHCLCLPHFLVLPVAPSEHG